MSDTMVEVRVYNKLLYDLIFGTFTSVRAFSDAVKVHQTVIGEYLNVRRRGPFKKNGDYSRMARKIASFFDVETEMLFPRTLYNESENNGVIIVELDTQEITCTERNKFRGFLPDNEVLNESVRDVLNEALAVLDERERTVIKMRVIQDKTLQECGDALNLSRERVRQIETTALQKLRQPSVMKKLSAIK